MNIVQAIVGAFIAGFMSMILLASYEGAREGGSVSKHTRRIVGYSFAVAVIVFLSLMGWSGSSFDKYTLDY